MTGHLGFHFEEYDSDSRMKEKGIYYGKYNNDGEIECTALVKGTSHFPFKLIPYSMVNLDGSHAPYVYYNIFGQEGNCPIGQFYLKLKFMGVPLSQRQTVEITQKVHELAGGETAYREPGYVLTDGGRKLKLIELVDTYRKFTDPPSGTAAPDAQEVVETLRELYARTTDKNAFMVIFSYALLAPLASTVKSRNLMFPNLIVLGPPEAGKNSLLNLLLAKGWGTRDNIRVVGDFKTDFASMSNLEGMGLPMVINDLDQRGYDNLRDYLLDGAMNNRAGSRGKADLSVQDFQVKRAIAISSNFLKIGAPEFQSRFIALIMQENEGNNEEWNRIALQFEGMMPVIARMFIERVVNRVGADSIIGLFEESRTKVKESIMTIGRKFLAELFPMDDEGITSMEILHFNPVYDRVEENYFELLYSWVQIQLAKMQKETSYAVRDYKETVTIHLDDSFYLRDEGEKFVVFQAGYERFLKENPSFPFKSMNLFAKRYRDSCRDIPRKFRMGEQRLSFRVLEMTKIMTDISVGEPKEESAVGTRGELPV